MHPLHLEGFVIVALANINKLKSVWFTRYSHPTLFQQIDFALLFIYHKCNYCSLVRFISTFGVSLCFEMAVVSVFTRVVFFLLLSHFAVRWR